MPRVFVLAQITVIFINNPSVHEREKICRIINSLSQILIFRYIPLDLLNYIKKVNATGQAAKATE
jgi:hypothetical protein